MKFSSFYIHFVELIITFSLQGSAGFFVKHVNSGMCINDTGLIESKDASWGSVSLLTFSNHCLDPASQFRFRENGAMLNLKRHGCLAAYFKFGEPGYRLDMLYLYVSENLNFSACAYDPSRNIYRPINQTSWGGLSVYYKGHEKSSFQTWCVVPKSHAELAKNYGIEPYIGLTTSCVETTDKRFNFGTVTCYGKMVENANCPKDQQYMLVKTASYRGLAAGKICGQNYDYSCEGDVTCVVKRECDRQHECQMTVDKRVFLDYAGACPGLTKYLYFEYQCVDTPRVHLCAPSGPPLNIRTTSRSTSSLTFVWDPPKQRRENGVILSYTACASESEDGPCFQTFVRATRKWDVRNLNASTKYYIRVLASNEGGDGNYSESKGFFTNGRATMRATANTANTLAFSLEIPSKTFVYLYVVALKLKEGEEIESSSTYEDNELVTYAEAIKSRHPIPYIAALILFSGVNNNNFILGDGSNTSDATTERGFAKTGYYNGPLEPGSSYSIFLRIFLGDKEDYYSTDWSASSKTSEYAGVPRVLLNMSNGKVTAKQGDLVNLLCSVQGEPPITFQWEKDKKALDSFFESHESISSSFLVVPVKDQTGFGKYICHIRDRFHTANHTIWINKLESASTVCTDVVSGEENTKVNLVGITVLAVLLTISLIVHVCFAHQYRRLKLASANASLENENKDRNSQDCKNREKNDENYEPVVVGASPYTVPEITGDGEYDDHVYSHLNEVQNDYENQKETGM